MGTQCGFWNYEVSQVSANDFIIFDIPEPFETRYRLVQLFKNADFFAEKLIKLKK